MKRRRRLNADVDVVGGLHRDDFEWAFKHCEGLGCVLVGFVLDNDGYHWKAIYTRADAGPRKKEVGRINRKARE